jgi:septum formation protein
MPSDLILASDSPRRAHLLRRLEISFRQIPSGAGEEHGNQDPVTGAREVALRKARAVARKHPDATVIGADTIVVSPEGESLGKPADPADALRMLKLLSGRDHRVITGIALILPGSGGEHVSSEITRVRMRAFDEEEAARYVAGGEPLDKAGAYGIQGHGALLVDGLEGCYFNVVGLPLRLLYELMRKHSDGADSWLGPPPGESLSP